MEIATGANNEAVSRRRATSPGVRVLLMGIMALLAVLGLAACGDASPTATVAVPTPTTAVTDSGGTGTGNGNGTTTEVNGTLREWAIDLSQAEVPAGKVKFTVTNQSQMQHNFTVTGSSGTIAATPNFSSSDGPQTLEVDLQPGTYTIICSLPGHAQRGQRIDLVVK